MTKSLNFFEAHPEIDQFEKCIVLEHYCSAPEDWWVATADVKGSTKAIEAGGYKGVNAAGAACITAIINAVGERDIPFVFGGDGATALIPNLAKERVLKALAGVRQMALEAFGLELRVGLVSIASLQQAGHDVLVARYGISKQAVLACFAGSGAMEAEHWLKQGDAEVADHTVEADADLTGFECRWNALPSRHGQMLSIIIQSRQSDTDLSERLYQEIVKDLDAIVGGWMNAKPVHPSNLNLALGPLGAAGEVMVKHHQKSKWGQMLQLMGLWFTNIFWTTFRLLAGRENFMKRYVQQTVHNSDFQKFDGMLRMVLDLSEVKIGKLEAYLQAHYENDRIFYGLHRSSSALMTCMVFSHTDDHIHFIDGNDGGYALAAKQYKEQVKAATAQA